MGKYVEGKSKADDLCDDDDIAHRRSSMVVLRRNVCTSEPGSERSMG